MFRRRKLSWVSSLEPIPEATEEEENRDQAPVEEVSSEQVEVVGHQPQHQHYTMNYKGKNG